VDKHFLGQIDSAAFIECLKTESAAYWAKQQ
jgi:hypothetical protein